MSREYRDLLAKGAPYVEEKARAPRGLMPHRMGSSKLGARMGRAADSAWSRAAGMTHKRQRPKRLKLYERAGKLSRAESYLQARGHRP